MQLRAAAVKLETLKKQSVKTYTVVSRMVTFPDGTFPGKLFVNGNV